MVLFPSLNMDWSGFRKFWLNKRVVNFYRLACRRQSALCGGRDRLFFRFHEQGLLNLMIQCLHLIIYFIYSVYRGHVQCGFFQTTNVKQIKNSIQFIKLRFSVLLLYLINKCHYLLNDLFLFSKWPYLFDGVFLLKEIIGFGKLVNKK